MNPPLTHRQRVRLALDHKETDRVPIATICAGLNEPVQRAVDDLLRRTRGTTLEDYLAPLIDVRQVWPEYVGPDLPADTDVWGVRRRPVSYGPAAYMEIDHYPLSGAGLDELAAYPWPSLEWYDYAGLPARLAETLLVKDKDLSAARRPVYVINPKYNAAMLVRAICKIENFRYSPKSQWHGFSSEHHFLHVTTKLLSQRHLDTLIVTLGPEEALLIYSTRRSPRLKIPDNVEVKRIPRDLLAKCTFEEDK